MHDDRLIGCGLKGRIIDHILKGWAFIVGGRIAGFDIFLDDDMPVAFRPLPHLPQLVGYRQGVFGLTGR
ncbi:MAG: hypothetical protein WCD70_10405 [Alphaproteobacteria bacterium]